MGDDRDKPAWPVDDLFDTDMDLSPNPADLLYQENVKVWEEIEFEPVDVSEEKLAALADAATQFHYIYLSQLLIIGDLLMNAPDAGTKRLATVLSASRMRDVDAWGQYISHLKLIRPKISPPLQEYFQQLYEEDNTFARLMGLIFVDVFRKALAEELQDVEDPTFRRLMQRDAAEGEKNVRLTKEHLQKVNTDLSEEIREVAEERIDDYFAMIEDIVDDRSVTLKALNANPDDIMNRSGDMIEEYRAIIRGNAG